MWGMSTMRMAEDEGTWEAEMTNEGGAHVYTVGGRKKLKVRHLLLPAICFGGIHWTGVLKLLVAVRAVAFADDVSVIHVIAVRGVGRLRVGAVIFVLHPLASSALAAFCCPVLAALVGLGR